MAHGYHSQHEQFSSKPWYKRAKQKFVELMHDSRDTAADTTSAAKHYSNEAIQKIIDRPMPYLIAASALGFLLSSLIRHYK